MLPDRIIQIENEYVGQNGRPTLGKAFSLLKKEWESGNRSREVGLHLMFLSWYSLAEPPFSTGLTGEDDDRETFHEVFERFQNRIDSDAEMLYVVGLMSHLFPWIFGDEEEWIERSIEYQQKYKRLTPNGIPPEVFEERGAYGDYFKHHAQIVGGY